MTTRTAARRRTTAVRDITGLRILPEHAPASLVNISGTGLLAETAQRCRVGGEITIGFEGGFEPDKVSGRVARCEVVAVGADGLLRYHVGVEFDSPLEIDDDEDTQQIAVPAARKAQKKNRW